jgi:hypothetical protein
MLKGIPDGPSIARVLVSVIGRKDRVAVNGVNVQTDARMSGDMCTSMGNGFDNLMGILFTAFEKGWNTAPVVVVEGDDAVFRVDGPDLTTADFAAIGFDIKILANDCLGDVGFCQLYTVSGENEVLCDPLKSLLQLGWSGSVLARGSDKVRMGLIRAKAFSAVCECPANPITGAFALSLIRATQGIEARDVRYTDDPWWARQCLSANLERCIERASRGPTEAAREFVSRKWHISPLEQQTLEAYFDGRSDILPVCHPVATELLSRNYPWWAWAASNLIV